MHAVNDRIGWLSSEAIDHIAERLDLGPAEVYGVATFYALFSTTERPPRQVHVCVDLACRTDDGPTTDTLPAGAHPSPCLGLCERAPAALVVEAGEPVRRAVAGAIDPVAAADWVGGAWPGAEAAPEAAVPQVGSDRLVLLHRVGRLDPLETS